MSHLRSSKSEYKSHCCYKHSVPTGLQTCRTYGAQNQNINLIAATNIPSLRDYVPGPRGVDLFVEHGTQFYISLVEAICL